MSSQNREAKLSTFANKSYELKAGIETCSQQLRSLYEVLREVLSRCNDLSFLAVELGLSQEEMQTIKEHHDAILKEGGEMVAVGLVCCDNLEGIAKKVEEGLGPYWDHEVTNPLQGLYTASEQRIATKVASAYLSREYQEFE